MLPFIFPVPHTIPCLVLSCASSCFCTPYFIPQLRRLIALSLVHCANFDILQSKVCILIALTSKIRCQAREAKKADEKGRSSDTRHVPMYAVCDYRNDKKDTVNTKFTHMRVNFLVCFFCSFINRLVTSSVH